jgi:hypothetical protein
LTKLLPRKLARSPVPPEIAAVLPKKIKTMADWLVQTTEEAIDTHLTTTELISVAKINPASVRAAIRRLREALKPFARGWVDSKTANILPAGLDDRLAARDKEISEMRLVSARRHVLAMLCQYIEVLVRQSASESGEMVSEHEMLRYIDAALNFAGIEHPNVAKHRDRLAALVFPKEKLPQSQG